MAVVKTSSAVRNLITQLRTAPEGELAITSETTFVSSMVRGITECPDREWAHAAGFLDPPLRTGKIASESLRRDLCPSLRVLRVQSAEFLALPAPSSVHALPP